MSMMHPTPSPAPPSPTPSPHNSCPAPSDRAKVAADATHLLSGKWRICDWTTTFTVWDGVSVSERFYQYEDPNPSDEFVYFEFSPVSERRRGQGSDRCLF